MPTVAITDVSRHFADYINRVAYRNERFILQRGGKIVAELRPVPQGRLVRDLLEILRSLPHLSASDAEAFAADLHASHLEQGTTETYRDPWA